MEGPKRPTSSLRFHIPAAEAIDSRNHCLPDRTQGMQDDSRQQLVLLSLDHVYQQNHIIKPTEFLTQVINVDLRQRGYSFEQFVQGWLQKMEMIVSWEATRINVIAIYNLLPSFPGELVRTSFAEIVRTTLAKLEHELYLKLSDST